MTAIHPHQLKPYTTLQRRAATALDTLDDDGPSDLITGVDATASYLRQKLGLTVHRELVYAWLQAGMPALLLHRQGGVAAPPVWTLSKRNMLCWLWKNGSIPGGRLRSFPSHDSRRSRHTRPKQSSIRRKASQRRNNKPMRVKKPSKRKGKKGPVHGV